MLEKYTVPKEIAKGVYLLTTGDVISASYVTKPVAEQYLSEPANK